MSTNRRSSRIKKQTVINVKLDESDAYEYVGEVGTIEDVEEVEEWTAEIIQDDDDDGDDDGDEELIVNPDGTMSIKMDNKSNGTGKDVSRYDCAKCGLSFPSDEVFWTEFRSLRSITINHNVTDAGSP